MISNLRRLGLVAVSAFLVTCSAFASDIVYRDFSEAVSGLLPNEVEALADIYKQEKVIHLEASGLDDLRGWLDAINQRFTQVIENEGTEFPAYSIDIMASTQVQAFIYKFRPAGQKVYRGHVFLSAGLVEKLFLSLGTSPDSADRAQVDEVLKALAGILAHEFMHPKQDELIKWEWREGQEKSRQNHGQGDEMATDLMAIQLLRKAKLPGDALLTGLELALGPKPQQGNYVSRAAQALASSHPQDNMRINIVRGALTNLRIKEGTPGVETWNYDFEGMRDDLKRVSALKDLGKQLSVGKDLTLTSLLRTARKELIESSGERAWGNKPSAKRTWNDYLSLIVQKVENRTDFSDAEIREWIEVLTLLRQKNMTWKFGEYWCRNGGASPGSPVSIHFAWLRKIQRLYDRVPMFRDPRFLKWFAETVVAPGAAFVHFEGSGLDVAPLLFTKELTERVYRFELDRIAADLPVIQVQKLGFMAYGTYAAGLSTGLELDVLGKLREVGPTDSKTRAEYAWVFEEIRDNASDYALLKDRVQAAAAVGESHLEEYLDTHWEFIRDFFSSPRTYENEMNYRFVFARNSFTMQILSWKTTAANRFKRWDRKFPNETAGWGREIEALIASDEWREVVRDAIVEVEANRLEFNGLMDALIDLPLNMRDPLKLEDRLRLVSKIVRIEPYASQSPNDWSNAYLRFRVAAIANEYSFKDALFRQLIQELKEAGVSEPVTWVAGRMGAEFSWSKDVFKNDVGVFAVNLKRLVRGGLSTQAELDRYLDKHVFESQKIPEGVSSLRDDAAYALWENQRDRGRSGLSLLRRLVAVHSLQDFDALDYAEEEDGIIMESAETAQAIDGGIHPNYAKVIWKMADGLVSDFRKMLGVPAAVPSTSPEFATAFLSRYPEAFEFIQLLFNPDKRFTAVEKKELTPFRELDDLAARWIELIPFQALSDAQAFEIWRQMAAKRSNRYTDRVFDSRILAGVMGLPREKRVETIGEILGYGWIYSERIKVSLLRESFAERIAAMKARAGKNTDQEISRLIFDIQRFAPSSSRFRDDFLEEISWALKLTEGQTLKFVEPLKSFNYKSIDPGTVNLLSTLSVIMEKMTQPERLAFIRHVQEPKDDLTRVIHSLESAVRQLISMTRGDEAKARAMIRRLDGFIQDASENERLVLIEMSMGSRGRGLWYQGESLRETLKTMAGLEPGTEKRKLFETYLKAIPEYEQTITLSYLLASKGEAQRSELLRVLETFGAPGIKFAQMASVLGMFGEKHSEELAQAKDRASPPSRAEIYALLRKHYSAEKFASVRGLERLLGSGSLKYVVLVEFEGGRKEAVYLRRPHLSNVIRSTMDLADRWMIQLREDPEFSDRYDYDFYMKSLREQLESEIQFPRERELSVMMAKVYASVPPYRGWKFMPVPVSKAMPQTDEVSHFSAVENAVPYGNLSESDRRIVGEYIIQTELRNLLELGVFDADRHLGNYLFDPARRVIYPVDMGQAYFLERGSFFSAGDRYQIARMIAAFAESSPRKGAELLWDSFREIGEFAGSDVAEARERFLGMATATLAGGRDMKGKLIALLAHLTDVRLRLPLKYSMGVFKGMMILLNEDYAKEAGEAFVRDRLGQAVKRQLLLGAPGELTRSLRIWVQSAIRDCDALLKRHAPEDSR